LQAEARDPIWLIVNLAQHAIGTAFSFIELLKPVETALARDAGLAKLRAAAEA